MQTVARFFVQAAFLLPGNPWHWHCPIVELYKVHRLHGSLMSAGKECVEGWRDPFIIQTKQSADAYRMIIGSGYKRGERKNGCVLQYTSDEVDGPWRYDGVVVEGDFLHGRVWECPALVQVGAH